jgi:hypothetical protein
MSDMHMVDNEDQRDDRKLREELKENPDAHVHSVPNRRQRRMIAKRRGVFKRPGLWGYINNGARRNQPARRDDNAQQN